MKKVSLSSTKSVMHLIYQVISSAIVFIIYFVWDLEGRLSWEYIDCFEFQLISNSCLIIIPWQCHDKVKLSTRDRAEYGGHGNL